MAKQTGMGQLLYSEGNPISNDIESFELSSPREQIPATGIDSSAVERLHGHASSRLAAAAYFNKATGQAHLTWRLPADGDVITALLMGSAIGDTAWGLVSKQVDYAGTREADGSFKFDYEALGNAVPLDDCESFSPLTHSSATNGASKDDSASSSNGLIAYLHIANITGTSVQVKIEDSSTGSSGWAAVITFTTVSDGSEPIAERKTATGTIKQFLRVTTTGTFSDAQFVVIYRRGTAEDDVDLS